MKRCLILVSILALTACTTDSGGGGSSSGVGSYNHGISGGYSGTTTNNNTNGGNTTNNTNNGNTNNQQEQIVHFTNFKQYFDDVIKTGAYYTDFVENTQNWSGHGGYKHYEYNQHATTGTNHTIYHHLIDEKEMQLLNYGVERYDAQSEFANDFSNYYVSGGYVHNREGVGANLYTPSENTTFTGGTLAYLDGKNDVFIKGDATYKYNSEHPELLLAFDNYYTFNIVKNDTNSTTTTVSGTNNTGDVFYDVTPGSYNNNIQFSTKHLKKSGIEEAGGTYEIYNGSIGGNTINSFYLKGSFGGTKQ